MAANSACPPSSFEARPSGRAPQDEGFVCIALAALLPTHLLDELPKPLELQLDHVLGGLILQLQRLLVEFLRRECDDHLGPAEQQRIDAGEALAQMILHARAA